MFSFFARRHKRPGACAHLGVRVCSGRGDGVDRVSTPIRTSRGRPPLAGSRLRWGAGGGGATGSSGRSSQRSLILEQAHQKGMPGGALRCIPRVAHIIILKKSLPLDEKHFAINLTGSGPG